MVGNVCSSNSISSEKMWKSHLFRLYISRMSGLQRVWINIVHEGDVEPIVLQLGEVTGEITFRRE